VAKKASLEFLWGDSVIQQTSLMAYLENLSKMQQREKQVYEVIRLAANIGITNNEISHYLNLPINCITGRTNGLYKKGLVKMKEKREDLYTGNLSIAWTIKW
jgi:CRP-like cAMP-binding protein